MSLESQVAALTDQTTALLEAVNVRKTALDGAVSAAQSAAGTAAADAVAAAQVQLQGYQTAAGNSATAAAGSQSAAAESATAASGSAAAAAGSASAASAASAAAEAARAAAVTAQNNAAAVVTGGAATLTPAAGKIPLADANAQIDPLWLRNAAAPSIRSALRFDFARAERVDRRVVFARAGQGWRFNSAGILVPEAAGVPRIAYDPVTLQPLGLMLEPQATSLLLFSDQFDNAVWGKGPSCAVSPNTVIAPNGTLTADTIASAGAVVADNRIQQFVAMAVSAGVQVSFAVWLRADAPVTTTLRLANQADGDGVNVPVAVTTQWQRFLAQRTFTGSSTQVRCCINSQASPVSVYAWRAQFEAAVSVSSDIETTAAQVTRAAESAQITLPYSCDILVQDKSGAEWRNGIAAGAYSLTPRSGFNYVSRVRAYPAGAVDSATKTAMAVAA